MSMLYSIMEASSVQEFEADLFILAAGTDDRAMSMMQLLGKRNNHISQIILIKYDLFDETIIREVFPSADIVSITVERDPIAFLSVLQNNKDLFQVNSILIDITSIRIPEMFTLLKYLKVTNDHAHLSVAYSTPIEYEFEGEPFTSYHSYYGNLDAIDLVGFGGISDDMSHSQMIIFLGFEGVLSEKVNEDVTYNKLTLVNNLPSFFEKYKDVSVINNYSLLTSRHEKMAYVPANNPFETYNYLSEQLSEKEPACVAPLSTKPVALGVCLYALTHETLRVVYPMAEKYNYHRSNSVHTTYLYNIFLDQI